MKKTNLKFYSSVSLLGLGGLLSKVHGADAPAATATTTGWQKPAWLTDLSLGAKESYDDNIYGVSGNGLPTKSSWITTVSPKVGFNFAPLLGRQTTFQTLSLSYSPDFNLFHDAPSQSYNAHKIGDTIKGKSGDFSFALDNALLYNDGSHQAPIYALNQTSNSNDKNRSVPGMGPSRERLAQVQDRATVTLQYDWDKIFLRPVASLLDYDLNTDWHNTGAAPWKGYQNYVDRYDVNGGLDVGFKVTKTMAVTVGYRYGHQYQQAYSHDIDALMVNGQQAQSSADYQRILLGLEGKPVKWLTVKLAGGPEFRDYNSAAPVNDDHPVNYYGEASLTATITADQSLAFTYKHWQWVSSTGKVPYADSSYLLTYHWNATKQLGLDLSAKFYEADYNCGSSNLSANSSLRDDGMETFSAGITYAFTPHFSANLGYTYDLGNNLEDNVGPLVGYREFKHQLVSLGAVFKF